MTAALVTISVALAAAVGALIACGWKLYGALQELGPERARTAAALLERDQARIQLAEQLAANITLTRRLTAAELELESLTTEAADAAAEAVRAADDPVAELNRVLAEPLLPADDPAVSGGDGGAADAVPPASAVGVTASAGR